MKRRKTRRGAAYYLLAALCAVVFLVSCAYIAGWYADKARIEGEGAEYRDLYRATAVPTLRTAAPTSAPAALPPSPAPAVTLPPPTGTVPAAPSSTPDLFHGVTEAPVYYSATTPEPEIRQKFSELLSINPDTVGYLEIPGLLSLPVVWRQDDNTHYMTHGFDGEESAEGSLFLDGDNRLGTDWNCVIYGHNMKNDTMFGPLDEYGGLNGVRKYPVVQFDTLYRDGTYVLIGAFHADVNPESDDYFNVRRFLVDEESYARFASDVMSRTRFYLPVGARYGDRLLVLVTCSGHEDRRMIVVYREVREGEDPEELASLIRQQSFRYRNRE